MGELNITFLGACVNLFGIVPGVPMRTVLPNALAVRFGLIQVPWRDDQIRNAEYYLMPHIATLNQRRFGPPMFLMGYHLTVANAKEQMLCREARGFSLYEYLPKLELSASVVFEGNAMAYFDIYGGRVWTEGSGNFEPRVTRVSIKTEGTPRIRLTALPGNILAVPVQYIETNELFIGNLDYEPALEDASFDFLLNYLVSRDGIPLRLDKRVPGMPEEPTELTMIHLGQRLKALGTLVETQGTVSGWRAAVDRGDEAEKAFGAIRSPVPHSRPSLLGQLVSLAIEPVSYNVSCSTSDLP